MGEVAKVFVINVWAVSLASTTVLCLTPKIQQILDVSSSTWSISSPVAI